MKQAEIVQRDKGFADEEIYEGGDDPTADLQMAKAKSEIEHENP